MASKTGSKDSSPGKAKPEEAKKAKEVQETDDQIILTIPDQEKPKPPPGAGRKPRAKRRRVSAAERKRQADAKESAEGAATVLLLIMDGMVGASFGEDCRMDEHEKTMILEPLLRILSRLDYATTQVIEKWTDPILLGMGLLAWSSRIYRLQSEKADAPDADKPEKETPAQGVTRINNLDVNKDDYEKPPRKKQDNIAYSDKKEMDLVGGGEGIEG